MSLPSFLCCPCELTLPLLLLLLQILILPIPPLKASMPEFQPTKLEDLLKLSDDVAAFNVMTYDYSYGRAGPNGPLPWQEQNVQEMMGDEPDPDEEETDRVGSKLLTNWQHYVCCFVTYSVCVRVLYVCFLRCHCWRKTFRRWRQSPR
jgi:hypothetical protein